MSYATAGGGGNGFLGMNPDVVEAQANRLQHLADQVQQLIHKVETQTNELVDAWKGEDARAFHTEWNGTHKPALQQARELIHGLSVTAKHEAQQQRSTSSH